MKKHTKIYTDYFGIGEQDKPLCEYCECMPINDIHHITGRGKGKDCIENLIGLCRDYHNLAHSEKLSKSELMETHKKNLKC
jgi:hypothetical protein